ncbi:hypothetical protein RCOM_0585130 [Ricinus communis]|uniref:Xyloglucan:xyloglucosyl transferase n=1 Tax=Ricinus communis TaxID=3988 RepID=B9SAD6_RICCO|nr:hypothetical protein RCOM_0585130 [Ricinus communis]
MEPSCKSNGFGLIHTRSALSLIISLTISSLIVAFAGDFNQDFDITWGDGRAKTLNNGQLLTRNLDKASGSGFQ